MYDVSFPGSLSVEYPCFLLCVYVPVKGPMCSGPNSFMLTFTITGMCPYIHAIVLFDVFLMVHSTKSFY